MRIKFTVLGMIACLALNPANAADSASREENIGVGTGAVIGAVAGGPFGAILGAAFGAKLGNSIAGRRKDVAALTDDLQGSRAHIDKLQKDIVALNGNIDSLDDDLEQMRASARPKLLTLMQAGIEMDLMFRTDEDVVINGTGERLHNMAASLAAMPDVYIKLDGYADARGAATYNQDLSARRVEHVRDLLLLGGVPDGRIQVTAHGETPATDSNADSYALQRKVSLTLYIDESPSFAANPQQ